MDKTCVIYCRESDKGQSGGHSTETQERMCRDYAKNRKIEVVDVYIEQKSWKEMKDRHEFKKALTYIKERKIDYLLVTNTDRFARNAKDHSDVKYFLKNIGSKLLSVTQSFTEEDSPESDMTDWILSYVNQFYSDNTSKKVAGHMKDKADLWKMMYRAPVWYYNKNIGTKLASNKVILVDDDRVHLVQEAFKEFATGATPIEELRMYMYEKKGLTNRNGNIIWKTAFRAMFENPVYIWYVKFRWKIIKWIHKPIIDKKTYDLCQQVIATRSGWASRSRKHNKRFYLRWFLKCWICWWRCIAEVHNKKWVEKSALYHCSQTTKEKHSLKWQYISQEDLETKIAKQFKTIELAKPLLDKILKKAKEILRETHTWLDKDRLRVQNKIMAVETRRNNVETKFLDSEIDKETYDRQKVIIKDELKLLYEQREDLNDDRDSNIEVCSSLTRLTDNLYNTYIKANEEHKKQLLWLFFDKFILKDWKISKVHYTKIIKVLIENKGVIIKSEWYNQQDSNLRP